jgi:GTP-binding protein
MTNLFVLIDSRHEPQKIDLEFMEWLGENAVPFAIVFTKLDKLSSAAAKIVTAKYLDQLQEQWEELPPVFYTSSANGRGRAELLDYIEELNQLPTIDKLQDENI